MLSRIMVCGALGAMALPALASAADAVPAPSFRVGSSWIFDETVERGTQGFDERRIEMRIERADAETMVVGIKRDGAPGAYEDHVVGSDWSLRRVIDGQEAPTAKPFAFPMTVGQTWTVDFTDPTVRGAQTSLHVHRTYKVVGWEDITVAAGTFRAIKVEASGIDHATLLVPNAVAGGIVSSPGGSTTMTQSQRGGTSLLTIRNHAEFYYVPATGNYVKSVEEQYNTDDVLVKRETRSLISYKTGV